MQAQTHKKTDDAEGPRGQGKGKHAASTGGGLETHLPKKKDRGKKRGVNWLENTRAITGGDLRTSEKTRKTSNLDEKNVGRTKSSSPERRGAEKAKQKKKYERKERGSAGPGFESPRAKI